MSANLHASGHIRTNTRSLSLVRVVLLTRSESAMPDSNGKKTKFDSAEEGADQLDMELVQAIQKLQEVQEELEKVNEEASDKVLEVEQKYSEIRRPVYRKRNEIIQEIPDFWLTAFLSHPALCELLTEEDQQVFKFLHSVDVDDFKDVKTGYSITFTFRPNPYFEDTKLVKSFSFSDEGTTSVSGTHPHWKDGMDLTNGVTLKKEGNKRAFYEESFFKWFTDTQQNESSDGMHDEVAEIIREDLWPNPLKYFNTDLDDEFEEDDDDDDEGDYPNGGESFEEEDEDSDSFDENE